MDHEDGTPRKRRWLGRILGVAAIAGAGALWRQRQQERELDEALWGDPRDLDTPSDQPSSDQVEDTD